MAKATKTTVNVKEIAGRLVLAEIENIIDEWDGDYGDETFDDAAIAKVKKNLRKKADKLTAKFSDSQEDDTSDDEGEDE